MRTQHWLGNTSTVIRRYSSLFKRRHLPLVVVIALAGVLVRPAVADTVNVNIDGINDPLLANVRNSLSVAAEHEKPWAPGKIRRLYRLAPNEIKAALAPFGYYNPTIEQTLAEPGGDGDTWQATFRIDRGPQTKVTALNLAVRGPGDELPEIREALRASKLATGKRLIHSQYTATKNALYTAAYDAGYLDARFSQAVIRVRPDNNTAANDLVRTIDGASSPHGLGPN